MKKISYPCSKKIIFWNLQHNWSPLRTHGWLTSQVCLTWTHSHTFIDMHSLSLTLTYPHTHPHLLTLTSRSRNAPQVHGAAQVAGQRRADLWPHRMGPALQLRRDARLSARELGSGAKRWIFFFGSNKKNNWASFFFLSFFSFFFFENLNCTFIAVFGTSALCDPGLSAASWRWGRPCAAERCHWFHHK